MIFNSDLLFDTVIIGVIATIVMDLWAFLQKKIFNIPSLNYALVGRWFLYFGKGKFTHNKIIDSAPMPGEMILGWIIHYLTGIIFAAVLLILVNQSWLSQPTPILPITFGIMTVLFPFLIMQPGFGFGVAASKTPAPNTARLRSLIAHTSFAVGLYLAAILNSLRYAA
ncbi:DUF2938 domain-containing protein [Aliikangiella maris]|uniref:DUF2938 domain-containing protein n=2 Tax=Aliikangiella maris TaxID=3162458 RepID=A0ABV3MS36_9GAMM